MCESGQVIAKDGMYAGFAGAKTGHGGTTLDRAGFWSTLSVLPLPRLAGVTNAQSLSLGRKNATAERKEISRKLAVNSTSRAISKHLGRSPSTMSREIRRNGGERSERLYWSLKRRSHIYSDSFGTYIFSRFLLVDPFASKSSTKFLKLG